MLELVVVGNDFEAATEIASNLGGVCYLGAVSYTHLTLPTKA